MRTIILDKDDYFIEMIDGVEVNRVFMTKRQRDVFKDGLVRQVGKKGDIASPWKYMETPVYMQNGYELVGRVIKLKNVNGIR